MELIFTDKLNPKVLQNLSSRFASIVTSIPLPREGVMYGQFSVDGKEDNTLRAFRVISVDYNANLSDRTAEPILYVEVAGLGFGYIDGIHYSIPVYASKEDFLNGKTSGWTDRRVTLKSALEAAKEKYTIDDDYVYFTRYKWDNNQPNEKRALWHTHYCVRTGEFSFVKMEDQEYPYHTKESCIEDNALDVAEFGETKTAKKETEWSVPLPETVTVVAPSLAEATEIVYDAIRNMVNKQ